MPVSFDWIGLIKAAQRGTGGFRQSDRRAGRAPWAIADGVIQSGQISQFNRAGKVDDFGLIRRQDDDRRMIVVGAVVVLVAFGLPDLAFFGVPCGMVGLGSYGGMAMGQCVYHRGKAQ